MALLGLLSLVQIVILPGYLLLRGLRLGAGIVATCILSFALSLVVNHVLVASLVVFGCYRPAAAYAIFAAELLLLLAWDGRKLCTGLSEAAAACRQRTRAFFRAMDRSGIAAFDSNSMPKREPDISTSLALRAGVRALIAAAVLVIAAFAAAGIAQTGRIFEQWDAVVSWNRWAIDWAANRLPGATSIYPQLLPTNTSLSYVFMQSSQIWIFAKAFQFLFCLTLLLATLDLARVENRFGYVPGVVITYALLVALLRYRMLSSGYVDVPLAFFGFVSFYALMQARNAADSRLRTKYLVVGALLAFGAAATKQNGLYVAAVYPLLAWCLVVRGDGHGRGTRYSGSRRNLPLLAGLCLFLAIASSPWYLYKSFDFQAGGDKNNTALLLTDFHQGRDLLQRLSYAGGMIVEATTPLGAAFLAVALAAALRDPVHRWLLATFVAPLGLIWAVAFSYDLRNVAVIVPFVGAAAGAGLMQIVAWAARIRPSRSAASMPARSASQSAAMRPGPRYGAGSLSRSLCTGHAFGLVTLLLIAGCLCISDDLLMDLQQRQQRMVGIPELNRRLYEYAREHPSQATIATDYQALRWLPELGARSVGCGCGDLSAFRKSFNRPDVRYVLVRSEGAAAEVREFLQGDTAKIVFENHGFAFYEKRADVRSVVADTR
jgi:hypothetical protein